ncbi:hypothetical protein N2597_00745 [Rhizobium sophoriradicis]|uniref:hypothetical protein n=1 Tax=Rhizobium sophoriradicis TaxID=1535245 RepID=UPI00162236BC|nr:hypothetical protein N2597_00745 [Rhizobium leguminosarum bv. phaseoli]
MEVENDEGEVSDYGESLMHQTAQRRERRRKVRTNVASAEHDGAAYEEGNWHFIADQIEVTSAGWARECRIGGGTKPILSPDFPGDPQASKCFDLETICV